MINRLLGNLAGVAFNSWWHGIQHSIFSVCQIHKKEHMGQEAKETEKETCL
tara:strand:+ start:197 stop:349 length:153 start_codon:yes stop_codon:yes gene_type:complete